MKNKCLNYGWLLMAILSLSLNTACSDEDSPRPPSPAEEDEEIPQIILDSDAGNCTDDLFAIHALFSYRKQGACQVLGVMNSMQNQQARRFMDCLMHYYEADDIPLGLVEGETEYFNITPYRELVDSVRADGKPLFEPTGIPLTDRLPAWKLYRKLLSQAPDNSVTIVCIGQYTNLGLLLISTADEYSNLSGLELIQQKVKVLHAMGGCFTKVPLRYSDGFMDVEYNIAGDVPLAQKALEKWPTQLRLLPVEVGMLFPSDHNEILSDYAWQPDSPIYQTYSRYDEWAVGDVGQYLWDAIALLHAILGESYFSCTKTGYVRIDDRGKTSYTEDEKGNTHIINVNSSNWSTVYQKIRDLAQFQK